MIYDTTVLQSKAVNEEKELDTFFESMENRFEYDTIAEATMIVISEQEENWNRFMEAVGIDELASVMEDASIIYEGARLDAFVQKINGWFEYAKKKLAEITKAFLNQVDKFVGKIDAAVIKRLEKAKLPKDFKFKGYEFGDLKTPVYKYKALTLNNPADLIAHKDSYTKEKAIKELVGVETSNVALAATKKYFGSDHKVELKNIDLSKEIGRLKNARNMKKDAKASYKAADKELTNIIKSINKLVKSRKNEEKSDLDSALAIVSTYYKSFANGAIVVHSTYMRAIAAASRQALSICTKATVDGMRAKNKKEPEVKPWDTKQIASNEGFVDTGTFLGAVEYI